MRNYYEVALEDGDGFRAYLVVEATDRPISFGGTRIDLSVTREMVRELAENMTLKLAGHGSPVGGAKAGLQASPDDPRLPQHLRRFAERCRDALSSTTILGKDMGAKQWMLDEIYSSLGMPQLEIARRHSGPRCPARLSELEGYIPNMTGQGVFWSIEQALRGDLSGATVLIQGFGVVGCGVAWHLARAGARIVGVSDRTKGLVNPRGMEAGQLAAARSEDGLVNACRLPGCEILENPDELLTREADVLILAAGSHLVDGRMALCIRSPLVVEAANVTLLPDAREKLHRRAVRVVPDVVANSASAALVGLQIASGNALPAEAVWSSIEKSIKNSTDAVERLSKDLDIDSKAAFRRVIDPVYNCRTAGQGNCL